MQIRFEKFLNTLSKNRICNWDYFVNFQKVYKNIEEIKIELCILNSLIKSKNIKADFKNLIQMYPNVLKAIPTLLAIRGNNIRVGIEKEILINFNKKLNSIEEYTLFMEKTGLFELIRNNINNNLVDYATGVEVGIDTNTRKNRTGSMMENLVEHYLINSNLIENVNYFKQIDLNNFQKKTNINIDPTLLNINKKFDFIFINNQNHIFVCECNFYNTSGSKLNEVARSYRILSRLFNKTRNITFVWFTDGCGWIASKSVLKETFQELSTIYNIFDLQQGIIKKIIDDEKYKK